MYLLAGTTDVIEGLDAEECRLLVDMNEALRHRPLRAGVRVLGRLTRERLARCYRLRRRRTAAIAGRISASAAPEAGSRPARHAQPPPPGPEPA